MIDDATAKKLGYIPLCGDLLCLYVTLAGAVISDVALQGSGCAISHDMNRDSDFPCLCAENESYKYNKNKYYNNCGIAYTRRLVVTVRYAFAVASQDLCPQIEATRG